jgi:hypothetical protein
MSYITDSLTAIQEASKGDTGKVSPGAGELSVCTLHHGPGFEYPIGDSVKEVHLFEDIETIGITGWLEMEDDINLIESGLIIGEELLYLKFETGGTTLAGIPTFAVDFTTHPLYVHGIQEVDLIQTSKGAPAGSLRYRLHFCSTEMLKNSRSRISKAYKGTYADIVKDVLDKDMMTSKTLDIAETVGLKHLICPNIHPFDFIIDMAANARSEIGITPPSVKERETFVHKGQRADYAFYETVGRSDQQGGFHFKPLSQLLDRDLTFALGAERATAAHGPHGSNVPVDAMLRAINFKIKNMGDKFSTIRSGMWASRLINIDNVTKSVKRYKSDYSKQLKALEYSHASQTKTFEGFGIGKPLTEWDEGVIRLNTDTSRTVSNINKWSGLVQYPWSPLSPSNKGILHRQMQLGHLLGYHRLELTLPGISGLEVGMMANAEMPDIGKMADTEGIHGGTRVWPNRANSAYVITKVAHILKVSGKTGQYLTRIEMANTMVNTELKKLPEYDQLGGGMGASGGMFT